MTRLRFTGFEAKWRWQVTSHQRIDLLYTGIHGAQQALAGLQSKYVFQYPVNAGTVTWWGNLPGKIDTHLRLGTVQRYGRDIYPVMEFSAGRAWDHLRPYLQLSNLTNTDYEEIPGVRLPGRAAYAGLEIYWRQGK